MVPDGDDEDDDMSDAAGVTLEAAAAHIKRTVGGSSPPPPPSAARGVSIHWTKNGESCRLFCFCFFCSGRQGFLIPLEIIR